MTARIYIDECGYTGEDLFNLDQPIFCLGSTSLSKDECKTLKEKQEELAELTKQVM